MREGVFLFKSNDAVTDGIVCDLGHGANGTKLCQLIQGAKVVRLDHALLDGDEEEFVGARDCQGLPRGGEDPLGVKEGKVVGKNFDHDVR